MSMSLSGRLVALASIGFLSACWGRNVGYGADTAPELVEAEVTECGDESLYDEGWRIEGNAFFQDSGSSEGLAGKCIDAIDPTPALTGGDPVILASSTICDDGSFVVAGIKENPAIGTFVVVDDCAEDGTDDLMTSATGISGSFIADLGPGDVLPDIGARVVSQDYRLTVLDELKTAGYDGIDDETFQFLGGRLIDDSPEAAPFDDYTLECGACDYDTYYADADDSDGLFTTGGEQNASTSAAADAFFMVPMANIGNYQCTDPDGNVPFTNTYGSLPGYGVFIEVRCVE